MLVREPRGCARLAQINIYRILHVITGLNKLDAGSLLLAVELRKDFVEFGSA
jgi:hypothetical protein